MVIFIPCCKQKRSRACKARDLCFSNLFQKQLEFALKQAGEGSVFILSAKHGIVGLDDILEPYEEILIPKNSERWGGDGGQPSPGKEARFGHRGLLREFPIFPTTRKNFGHRIELPVPSLFYF